LPVRRVFVRAKTRPLRRKSWEVPHPVGKSAHSAEQRPGERRDNHVAPAHASARLRLVTRSVTLGPIVAIPLPVVAQSTSSVVAQRVGRRSRPAGSVFPTPTIGSRASRLAAGRDHLPVCMSPRGASVRSGTCISRSATASGMRRPRTRQAIPSRCRPSSGACCSPHPTGRQCGWYGGRMCRIATR